MGSLLYDFLTESLLFSPALIDEGFVSVDETRLDAELQRYREYCLARREELVVEAVGSRTGFRLFCGLEGVPLRQLKQTALYVDGYVLSDPLFPFTERETEQARVMRTYLGYGISTLIDRAELASTLRRLRELAPMVAANYVKWLPFSYLFEPPSELPIYYSESQFAEEMPFEVSRFFHERAIVENLRRDRTGWVSDASLPTARAIAVGFQGDSGLGMIHQLFDCEVRSIDEATREVTGRITLSDALPNKPYYDHWVRQSVNRTAINITDRILKELSWSRTLGTAYLCGSGFHNEFLTRFFPVAPTTEAHTANVLLKLEVPFLDEIDTGTLMAVRRDECESFRQFRHFLEQQFWDLQHEPDSNKARRKAEKVLHEIGTVQHGMLGAKVQELRRGALAQAVVVGATLTGTFLAGRTYWPALIVAGAGVYKLASEYRAALRQTPAFFLWKARSKGRG